VSAEEEFTSIVDEMLREPGVEEGAAFHNRGLKVGGKIFAMLVQGELVVKLPADRVAQLVGDGTGRPFESGRRVMKEWVSVPPSDETEWLALAREAHRFVGSI
jgi:YjbR protein